MDRLLPADISDFWATLRSRASPSSALIVCAVLACCCIVRWLQARLRACMRDRSYRMVGRRKLPAAAFADDDDDDDDDIGYDGDGDDLHQPMLRVSR